MVGVWLVAWLSN